MALMRNIFYDHKKGEYDVIVAVFSEVTRRLRAHDNASNVSQWWRCVPPS